MKGYDYTLPGAYFVTIVTRQGQCFLGSIRDEKVYLSKFGEIVQSVWLEIPNHKPMVRLDKFVVMPNHFHGILWLETNSSKPRAYAQTSHIKGTKPGSLNSIVQNFKSVSTRKVNQHFETPSDKLWQRDYFERIIRNERELEAIRKYILGNPRNWESDLEYVQVNS